MSNDPKRFRFLCTGEVIFSAKDTEGVHSIRLNAIASNDKPLIPVRLLGRMQQGLQYQFHQRMQDPTLTVVDVVILNIVSLGEMTKEELHAAAPEGSTGPAPVDPFAVQGGQLNG